MVIDDKVGCGLMVGAIGVVATILIGTAVYNFQPHSRRTLNPSGKTIEYKLPTDYKRMISVSSAGSEGDAMITYETNDGKVVSKEYNRGGLWETTVNWVEQDKK